jgi:hypothetical protein
MKSRQTRKQSRNKQNKQSRNKQRVNKQHRNKQSRNKKNRNKKNRNIQSRRRLLRKYGGVTFDLSDTVFNNVNNTENENGYVNEYVQSRYNRFLNTTRNHNFRPNVLRQIFEFSLNIRIETFIERMISRYPRMVNFIRHFLRCEKDDDNFYTYEDLIANGVHLNFLSQEGFFIMLEDNYREQMFEESIDYMINYFDQSNLINLILESPELFTKIGVTHTVTLTQHDTHGFYRPVPVVVGDVVSIQREILYKGQIANEHFESVNQFTNNSLTSQQEFRDMMLFTYPLLQRLINEMLQFERKLELTVYLMLISDSNENTPVKLINMNPEVPNFLDYIVYERYFHFISNLNEIEKFNLYSKCEVSAKCKVFLTNLPVATYNRNGPHRICCNFSQKEFSFHDVNSCDISFINTVFFDSELDINDENNFDDDFDDDFGGDF